MIPNIWKNKIHVPKHQPAMIINRWIFGCDQQQKGDNSRNQTHGHGSNKNWNQSAEINVGIQVFTMYL
jgi:hypothetical protein